MLSELFTLLLLVQRIQVTALEHDFARPWIKIIDAISEEEYRKYEATAYPIKQVITDLPAGFQLRLKASCTEEQQRDCHPKDCVPNTPRGTVINPNLITPYTNAATYRCECGNDTLQDYLIDNRIYAKCVKRASCDKCDPDHTVKCLELGNGKVSCVCDPGYMEDTDCHRKKDGCKEMHMTASLKGDTACRVDEGNLCLPMFQSLRYSCVCRSPFIEDKRLSFPNCMRNDTPCQRPLCLGFQPPIAEKIPGPTITIDSLNMVYSSGILTDCNQTSCNCPDGWLGPHCSEQRGEAILGSWSPWSTCSPDCIMPTTRQHYQSLDGLHAGTSRSTGIGYRSRFSRCSIKNLDFCVGTYRFWRRCHVTTVCNTWTNTKLSTVVNEAIEGAMTSHDFYHRPDQIAPIMTTAAQLDSVEQHYLNFITVAASFIYSCISIWVLELHHMMSFWSKPVTLKS